MNSRQLRTALVITTSIAAIAALFAAATPAQAQKPGSGGSGTCVRSAPQAHIVNTYAWASPGSWGMPGQQLTYAVDVVNTDNACGASSFAVTLAAPNGFTVSAPVSVSVGSASDSYAYGTVTSPTSATDGSYAVTATVSRAGSAPASAQSVYKVYSSDTAGPSEYWLNPADASSVSGRSISVGFAASDDHQVTQLSIAIDGVTVTTTSCSDVRYECQASYAWSTRRVSGVHTATFTARDYVGNVSTTNATFSVN